MKNPFALNRNSLIVASFVIVIAVLVHILNIKNISEIEKSLLQKDKELQSAIEKIEDLNAEKQTLLSLERIENIATTQLALVPNAVQSKKIKVNKREIDHINSVIIDEYESN